MTLIKVIYSDKHDYNEIRNWCHENCQHIYYSGWDWSRLGDRMYEFESEADAIAFMLKWS